MAERTSLVPRRQLYGPDLAAIQQLGFGDFVARAAPELFSLLRRAGVTHGKVVDLGCGAGVWLRELDRAGYDAVGVDSSPALVKIARRVAPAAAVHLASLHDFELPECDAVTAIGEVLSYIAPPGRKQPLARTFDRVAAALRPGGLFVFDVLVASAETPAGYRSWRAGDSWAVLAEITPNARCTRLTRDITTFRRVGTSYRRGHERHELVIARREAVTAALRAADFTVRVHGSYGDFEMLPGRLAFAARKRGASRGR